MVLSTAVSLASRPRCFGCRSVGAWACHSCCSELGPPGCTERVPGVDRVVAAWSYEGVARDLILALKLRGRRAAAGPLADALACAVQSDGSEASSITWVPGRPRDMRRRGFDHAELIARSVADALGIPVFRMLTRAGDRPDQTALSGADRRRNLTGAFLGASQVPDKVMVVDDLVTTGATAAACARALHYSGATYVEVAAPCRA